MSQTSAHPVDPFPQVKTQIFTVVLTGGIASGKSTVSDLFVELGVSVIDTDKIARELVEPGLPALTAITDTFGIDYLDSEGRLNRKKMRSAIFQTPEMKTRLEQILHPRIRQESIKQVSASSNEAPYCILVIPLFVESSAYNWVDRVLLVDSTEASQIARVVHRDRVTKQQAKAILATQASRKERLSIADDVISNELAPDQLKPKVKKLHKKYLELSYLKKH